MRISRAIRIEGNHPAYHANLGEVYRAMGQLDSAAACYKQVLRLDPSLAEPHALKARHLGDVGRRDEGLAELEIALRLDPNSAEVNRAGAMLNYAKRDFATAARFFPAGVTVISARMPSYFGS